MYGRGSIGGIRATSTGVGGVISILGGAAVLPNTNGNLPLIILGISTVILGSLIVASFVISRLATAYYTK